MRARLANFNHCAVSFSKPRRRQLVLVLLYISDSCFLTPGPALKHNYASC